MERHGIIDGEDVYYCDICGIYQSYPLDEEALLAAEKSMFFKPVTTSERVTISCDECKHEQEYSTKNLISFNENGFPTCSKCYPKFNQGVDKPNSYTIIKEHNAAETYAAEIECPPATQDVAINTKNRNATIKNYEYGPLNVDEPGDYWEQIAKRWKTTVKAAKKSKCGNCVAFDRSPRMKDCMPGETSDGEGVLGYCWMHHFKCHSARTCDTWAKGGPITTDKISEGWQERAFAKPKKSTAAKEAKKGAKEKAKAAETWLCETCGCRNKKSAESFNCESCGCSSDEAHAETTEKKQDTSYNCIACGHHSAHIKMGDDRFCNDCYHYAETFNAENSDAMKVIIKALDTIKYPDIDDDSYILDEVKEILEDGADEDDDSKNMNYIFMALNDIKEPDMDDDSYILGEVKGILQRATSKSAETFEGETDYDDYIDRIFTFIDEKVGTEYFPSIEDQEEVARFKKGFNDEFDEVGKAIEDANDWSWDEILGAETFNSYKVAPELSSYTVDELVDSIAGPQGSAAYDEMVYDPIAQDRLSAESVSIPHTLLLLGGIVAGLGCGVLLTKKLGDINPENSDDGGA